VTPDLESWAAALGGDGVTGPTAAHRPTREHPPRGVRVTRPGLPLRRAAHRLKEIDPATSGPAQRGHLQRRAPPQGGAVLVLTAVLAAPPPLPGAAERYVAMGLGHAARTCCCRPRPWPGRLPGGRPRPGGGGPPAAPARRLPALYMVPVGRPPSPEPQRQEAESHPAVRLSPLGQPRRSPASASASCPPTTGWSATGQRTPDHVVGPVPRPRAGGASARREGTTPPGGEQVLVAARARFMIASRQWHGQVHREQAVALPATKWAAWT